MTLPRATPPLPVGTRARTFKSTVILSGSLLSCHRMRFRFARKRLSSPFFPGLFSRQFSSRLSTRLTDVFPPAHPACSDSRSFPYFLSQASDRPRLLSMLPRFRASASSQPHDLSGRDDPAVRDNNFLCRFHLGFAFALRTGVVPPQ